MVQIKQNKPLLRYLFQVKFVLFMMDDAGMIKQKSSRTDQNPPGTNQNPPGINLNQRFLVVSNS